MTQQQQQGQCPKCHQPLTIGGHTETQETGSKIKELYDDAGLKEVRGLTNLKRIYFVGTKVTDDGLEYLKPLKTIEFVGPSENISSNALKALKQSLPLFEKNNRG